MSRSETARVALVTGAGTGIGAAIARRFGQGGDIVVLAGLGEGELEAVAAQIRDAGGQAVAQVCDVADRADRAALFALIDAEFGRVDTLVNNAGISGPDALGPAMDETEEHHRRLMDVNLSAAYFLAQEAGRRMRDAGGGSIINISSVGGSAAQLDGTTYCMTKAGLDAMARNLCCEWAPFGIRVNSIAPGDIRTETSIAAEKRRMELGVSAKVNPLGRGTPMARAGTPDEVAEMAWFLASDAASFVSGESIRVDGGYLAY